MNRFIQVPAKGQPMTAQWGADVANGLNAIRSAGQAGTLLTDGPTGTGFAPLPANRRDRQAKTVDRSCFRIETRPEEDGSGSSYITCCYYHVGGVTKHMEDVSIDGLIPSSGSPEDKTPWIICLKLFGSSSEPSIVAIEESRLEEEQRIADNYVLPLYRYLGSTLHDDLRNAPNVQQWEVGLT
ncbi:MAG: hypothetical protein ACI4RD_05365 [Kiritimatiellia bacterium]